MEVPVLVTKSAYYNFLREYWLGCYKPGCTPRQLVYRAAVAWQGLMENDRKMFDEDAYISARLAIDLLEPMRKLNRKRKAAAAAAAKRPKFGTRKMMNKGKPKAAAKWPPKRRPKQLSCKKSKLTR